MIEGGCRCGAVRYQVEGDPRHHALCHCRDCQLAHGAPVVAWIAFAAASFRITRGTPNAYTGASGSVRHFCGACGTPLHFQNEAMMPGIIDLPSVTLDQPDIHPPQAQIQLAEARPWMLETGNLPAFPRFPGA